MIPSLRSTSNRKSWSRMEQLGKEIDTRIPLRASLKTDRSSGMDFDDVSIMHDMVPFDGRPVVNAVPPDAGELEVRR